MGIAQNGHPVANGARDESHGMQGSVENSVQDYYGKTLKTSKDLKTSACTAAGRPHPEIRKILKQLPSEVTDKFYGCGAPLPLGIDGLKVLDLGSGSGRDAYVCAALVGEAGHVTGVDFTEEQLEVAKRHAGPFCSSLGYQEPNMHYVKGDIQDLQKAGIADSSVDLIISNCVINLCSDKLKVLKEAYRVLADGGELYFSDVYCDRRLPKSVLQHEVLWGECIAGALYTEDFKRFALQAGFGDVRTLSSSSVAVTDPELLEVVGNASFFSHTYRLFKLPGLLESQCEDYGQYAVYKGTIPGHRHQYQLDNGHSFQTGKPELVCGNTAAMLGEGGLSWLAKHFQVHGDRSTHYGLFGGCGSDASTPAAAVQQTGACC